MFVMCMSSLKATLQTSCVVINSVSLSLKDDETYQAEVGHASLDMPSPRRAIVTG